jgi:transcriptional regulator with XRE-family HTH domain
MSRSELTTTPADPVRIRPRVGDVDRQIGARIRERRIMLGLTQQQAAELIGVTYQQEHKYEKGINRVAAGRLYAIARAFGVEVGHFFEGISTGSAERTAQPTGQQRLTIELARNFLSIQSRKHQEALCQFARALAEADVAIEPGVERASLAAA